MSSFIPGASQLTMCAMASGSCNPHHRPEGQVKNYYRTPAPYLKLLGTNVFGLQDSADFRKIKHAYTTNYRTLSESDIAPVIKHTNTLEMKQDACVYRWMSRYRYVFALRDLYSLDICPLQV